MQTNTVYGNQVCEIGYDRFADCADWVVVSP
ncbi:MAG: hypothetical protein ACI9N0_003097 [Ilumatobacter sp.]|jgi:hypothetical protein